MKRFVLFLLLSLVFCVPVWADEAPPDDAAPPPVSEPVESPAELPPEVAEAPSTEIPSLDGEIAPGGFPGASSAPDELEIEPTPEPEATPEPTPEPTPPPHLVWDTPFEDYTVTEGLLLLVFVLLALCVVLWVFK